MVTWSQSSVWWRRALTWKQRTMYAMELWVDNASPSPPPRLTKAYLPFHRTARIHRAAMCCESWSRGGGAVLAVERCRCPRQGSGECAKPAARGTGNGNGQLTPAFRLAVHVYSVVVGCRARPHCGRRMPGGGWS